MKKYSIGLGIVVLLLIVFLIGHHHGSKPAASNTPTKGSYVALGDSVAAGVGLEDYSDASACDRTNQSYPNQVANTLHYSLKNLSCSGATLPAGILGKQDVNDLMVDSQLQQLFALSKPSLITLTIGANDAHWTDILSKCYTGECGTAEDSAEVQANLQTAGSNLQTALAQIKAHYAGTTMPKVLIIGYYQVFPTTASATCSDLTGIDASELSWGRQFQADLNAMVQGATSASGFAKYVPIDFSGHELCSPNPWVQGLNDSNPYHPTADGQAAIAKQLIETK